MLVVLPFCRKDAHLAKINLELVRILDREIPYPVLLSYDDQTLSADIAKVKELAGGIFPKVTEFRYDAPTVPNWPQAANHAFQSCAWHIYHNAEKEKWPYWFWWEADAVPLRPHWLTELEQEYRCGKKPFMGHIVDGMGHMNGVGFYPWNVCDFTRVAMYCRAGPWDVEMRAEMIDKCHKANHLIQHIWRLDKDNQPTNGEGRDPTFPSWNEAGHLVDHQAALLHRCKDGTLPQRLIERQQPNITEKNVGQFSDWAPAIIDPPPQKVEAKVHILIVTHKKDLPWLQYCLKALQKFASGFSGITLAVPKQEANHFTPLEKEFGVRCHPYLEKERKGMLHHMAMKCSADKIVPPDTDFVMHMDADCIVKEPIVPGDYFHEGKPVYLIRSYASLIGTNGVISDCMQWRSVAAKALGYEPEWYTMCRHPTVFPLGFYKQLRNHVAKATGQPFLDYVLDQKNSFPQTFAEFPTMGAFAHKAMPEEFHWIDVEKEPAPKDKIKTFWSHGGLDGCEPGHESEPKPRQLIESWLEPTKAKPAPKITTGTGIDHDAVNAALGLNADRSNYGQGILPNPFASQCKEWERRKTHAKTIALITDKIEALFEPRFITPPETSGFIEALITMSDARRVLEVGTHTAFGTLHMLRAIVGKEGAGLVSIDSRPTHDRAFFALPQIAPWFTHVAGSTPEVLKKLHGSYFDLVFVDSDHSVEHCEKERLALMDITKPGSIWLFHDLPEWPRPDDRNNPPVVKWIWEQVASGFFKGLILPTCEQLDCLAMWGPGYPPQCNPHLGVFIRQ